MKPSEHTSMRWMQQRLRYLAYMATHGKDEHSQPPQPRTEQESALTGTHQQIHCHAADRGAASQR